MSRRSQTYTNLKIILLCSGLELYYLGASEFWPTILLSPLSPEGEIAKPFWNTKRQKVKNICTVRHITVRPRAHFLRGEIF